MLVDGRRVNSCLTLAVAADGAEITTIEGLANGDTLSPVQAAFLEHDGFQCGYCTPGQICSATALLEEHKHSDLSASSPSRPATPPHPELTDDEIRERMSGNICRCGAYPNIVAAVRASSSQRSHRMNPFTYQRAYRPRRKPSTPSPPTEQSSSAEAPISST